MKIVIKAARWSKQGYIVAERCNGYDTIIKRFKRRKNARKFARNFAVKRYKQAVTELNGIVEAEKAMFDTPDEMESRKELEAAMLDLAWTLRSLIRLILNEWPKPFTHDEYRAIDQLHDLASDIMLTHDVPF